MAATPNMDIPGAVRQQQEDLASSSSSSFSPRKTRFFEYCSLIPEAGETEKKAAPQGKPRLCARTYSLPMPSSSAMSDFAYKIVNGRDRSMRCDDDPAFIPNSASKLNVKLPSLTRKRRNTTSSAPAVRGCLKNGKQSSNRPSMPPRAQSSGFNPVYCPALARISSSPSSLPNGDFTYPTQEAVIDHTSLPEDLMPLSPCCEKCHDGVLYGQSPDSGYMENWSSSALRKRAKDEEAKYERGELKRKDGKPKLQDQVDELPPLREVPECVDELELAKRRLARLDLGDTADLTSQPSVTSDGSSLLESPFGSQSSQSSMEEMRTPPCVKPGRSKCSQNMEDDDLAAALAEADKIIAVQQQPASQARPQLQGRESGSGFGRLLSRSFGSPV